MARYYYFRKSAWPSGEQTVNIVAILPTVKEQQQL
jgi:hypothetical protein